MKKAAPVIITLAVVIVAAVEGAQVERLIKVKLALLTKENIESAANQSLLSTFARP